MADILDYLDWRGDLGFERDGFNEVDNLVMSSLSYTEFDGIVPGGADGIFLSEAARLYQERGASPAGSVFLKNIPDLLLKAADTERYGKILISHYVNFVDYERAIQFSAAVFSFSGGHYVAFRGTDDTIAGWKEDFTMGFKDGVPAQLHAARYLVSTVPSLNGDIYVGGHSKGGNLAVYASAMAPWELQDRITAVYNNDGPGFLPEFIKGDGYQRILGKINTYIPRTSVVGMLFEHGETYNVVGSSENGIMSHNALTWCVSGKHLINEKELTRNASNLSSALRSWIDSLQMQQREEFVDALFEMIRATGAHTLVELSRVGLGAADSVLKTYIHMDEKAKALLRDTIAVFIKESQKVWRISLGESIGAFLTRKPDANSQLEK